MEVVGGAEIRPDQGDQGSFHRFREWSTDTPAPVHLILLISTSLFLPEPGNYWRYLGRRSAGRRSSAVGSASACVRVEGSKVGKTHPFSKTQTQRKTEVRVGQRMRHAREPVSPDPRPEGARAESGPPYGLRCVALGPSASGLGCARPARPPRAAPRPTEAPSE